MVRVDLDGHGRSPLTGPVSIDQLTKDLGALVATLPGGMAHVVAHSLGTLVAQQLAATEPERVRSLVLLGPVRAQADTAKAATRARAVTVREQGMAAVADVIVQNATSPSARAANLLLAGTLRELILGQKAEAYAQACEALAAAENPDLSQVIAPVLLLAGTDDKVSPDATREAMRAELKNVKEATTPGCGHWTVTEAPAFVAEQSADFLRAIESDARG